MSLKEELDLGDSEAEIKALVPISQKSTKFPYN